MNVAYYDEDGLSQHFRQADRFSLADPEAAGWALWAARKLLDGEEPAAVYEAARAHARWADENGGDWPCRAYVYRVLAKVGFDLAPEGHHGVAEV